MRTKFHFPLVKIGLISFAQVKLFWKEVREDIIPSSAGKMIWDELPATVVDTQKLEHLFESRAKDMMSKVYTAIILVFLFVVCFEFGA